MKRYLSILIAIVMLFSVTACSSGSKTPSDSTGDTGTTEEVKTTKPEKNQTAEAVKTGFNTLNAYDKSLNLTKNQSEIVSYFSRNCFEVTAENSLSRNPKQFRGVNINFLFYVQKILNADDDTFTIVGQIFDSFDDVDDDVFDNSVVICGKQDDYRIIAGDYLSCEGVYDDIKDYEINSASYQLPTVNVYSAAVLEGVEGDFESAMSKSAKAILGDEIKVRDAVEGVDFDYDEIHDYSYFKIAEFPEEKEFPSFEVYSSKQKLVKVGSTIAKYVTLQPSADFENYFLFTENLAASDAKIEYVSSEFKTIWSKDIAETQSLLYDYNTEILAYIDGSDLHIVDIKTGEEKASPVYVGQRYALGISPDGGIVLVGEGNKDNIIKVSADGNIDFKLSVNINVSACKGIQAGADSSVKISLFDDSGYDNLVSVSSDGQASSPVTLAYHSQNDYYEY